MKTFMCSKKLGKFFGFICFYCGHKNYAILMLEFLLAIRIRTKTYGQSIIVLIAMSVQKGWNITMFYVQTPDEDRDYFQEDFLDEFPQPGYAEPPFLPSSNHHDDLLDGDDDFYDSLSDYDDDDGYDYNEYSEPVVLDAVEHTAVRCYGSDPQEIRAPKKTQLCHDFAYEVVDKLGIWVLKGEHFLLYDNEMHCYKQVASIKPYILDVMADDGRNFSTREIGEVEDIIRIRLDFAVEADSFNRTSALINTRGGVLNWQTLEVSSHSKEDKFTYCVDATFCDDPEPLLHTPTFDSFCATSLEGDEKKRQLLLEIVGYCLSDCTGAKCAFFLKGEPNSGKSIMLEFISKLLVPSSAISSIPLHKLHERFNRAALYGKKINVAGEIKGKSLTDISTFKSITGGDQIEAEFKGKNMFFFTPRCKLVFAGNTLPGSSESDATAAFANRLAVVLFNKSIPEGKQDKELLAKLLKERDGIFTKAIYALRTLHEGNYRFEFPTDSEAFLADFSDRHNSLEGFMADHCERVPKAELSNVQLYDAYLDYCSENGLDAFSRNKLYEMISGIPGVRGTRVRIGGKNLRGHRGLQLVP